MEDLDVGCAPSWSRKWIVLGTGFQEIHLGEAGADPAGGSTQGLNQHVWPGRKSGLAPSETEAFAHCARSFEEALFSQFLLR